MKNGICLQYYLCSWSLYLHRLNLHISIRNHRYIPRP